jgi:hypothetical protein
MTLSTGQIRQRRDVLSDAVYCSQSDVTLNSGLGAHQGSTNYKFRGQSGRSGVPHPEIDSCTLLRKVKYLSRSPRKLLTRQ